MKDQRLTYYIDKYTTGTLSAEELRSFAALLKDPELREAFEEYMEESWVEIEKSDMDFPGVTQRVEEALAKRIAAYDTISAPPVRRISFMRRWGWAAASILLLLAIGALLWLRSGGRTTEVVHTPVIEDVQAPQTSKAMITLADGSIINVDSLRTLSLRNIAVTKMPDGKIVYTGNTQEVAYNTLSNPKGSKVVDLTLTDGSRIWLNAGSSVTYPIAFTGSERNLNINGEAYLEIAHDQDRPFYVTKGDMRVKVLGTRFNVNAYDDENGMTVTLLEGRVKVRKGNEEELLKPGQQAQIAYAIPGDQKARPGIKTEPGIRIVKDADLERVMAWKNGLFNFEGADLETVMRQLEKWYAITVIYEKDVPALRLGGEMKRDESLLDVLEILKRIGVNYRIEEGRKLIVLP
ncbi:FecR family protein [Pseudobacter ginsenosidimutans]|uniref:FecR family protein n=1 Tax=Pseudobacter ginsenosidimutans TaxID=661488 RepID=A0A4Q7N0B1_9BACT|nr:FecR domain-containing protein [Pseudobacter ginsenosidimutans]QEC43329.1 DUF4974 domain-containing protein [Pseudobacter ginsenosidimutans]RZS74693.1 FecR family protein [Pseudobacter ginsenosidimutans]